MSKYWGFVFAFSFACASSPTGRKQLILVPDEQMNQMGAQAFTQLKKEQPTESDPKINGYVQCVGKAISQEVGGKWEIVVFKDNTPNAFALPGGKIGVHTGLLKVAKNQHQLAAVMGHEVGHVLARHGAERVSEGLVVEGGLNTVNALMGNSKSRGYVMGALGLGAQFGVMLPHSRKHESEADVMGLDLMGKAGFDPDGSVKLWENMARAGGQAPPEFMSTHPSHETRIRDLRAGLAKARKLRNQAHAKGKKPTCVL